MIFGNIHDLDQYSFLTDAIKEFIAYAKEHSLQDKEKGFQQIDVKRFNFNRVEYTTTTPENRFWEAHRQYLDVHLLLEGQEQIDLNFIQNLEQGEYVEADDFLALHGEKNSSVVLREGDFLICYPVDGHRTAVEVNGPETVKKVIFKVLI